MLGVFTGQGMHSPPTEFMSCNANVLRCAFVIAIFLRELLSMVVSDIEEKGVTWAEKDGNLLDVNVNGIKLEELMPPFTKQRDTLSSNLLTLTEQEYISKDVSKRPVTGDETHVEEPGITVDLSVGGHVVNLGGV